MQFGVISLIMAIIAFVGIMLWTFSKSKKKDFEEASQIPLNDDIEHVDDKLNKAIKEQSENK